MNEKSESFWIDQLKRGDTIATREVWDRYFERLLKFLRVRLRGRNCRMADEEDVAVDTFNSLFRRVASGQFTKLQDSRDLWQILLLIATRKARRRIEYECRAKRGNGRVRGESVFMCPHDSRNSRGLQQFRGSEPTPELSAIFAEQTQRLLDLLGEESLRRVVLLKMEGHTNMEIAGKQGCKLRTIERKLRLIRQVWAEEATTSGRK